MSDQSLPIDELDLASLVPGTRHGTVVQTVTADRAAVIDGYLDHAGVQRGDVLFTLWQPASRRCHGH